jgi:hypothetical protein
MQAHELIRQTREGLGLDDVSTAQSCGLSVDELGDIEQHAGEFESGVPARSAVRLSRMLALPLQALLSVRDESPVALVKPGEYVRTIRVAAQVSEETLDDLLGYENGFIRQVEAGQIDLTSYPLELSLEIAARTCSSPSHMVSVIEGAVIEH